MRFLGLCTLLLWLAASASGDDLSGVGNADRARTNYMLNCQGCHGHDGSASRNGVVPAMKDFVGGFLLVPGGREYLVQVPGSANAAISDAELAELLNWLLPKISPGKIPRDFVPYSTREVAQLRGTPERDVIGRRAALVAAIGQLQSSVSSPASARPSR